MGGSWAKILDHEVILYISPVFYHVNSFLASGDFCRLLTFANSLDLDHDGQTDRLIEFMKDFSFKC